MQKDKLLLSWYRRNARPLPWRQSKIPYKVWISEVMLQQTTAQAVIPYYKAFLKKFPDLKHLATAKEEEVLSAWSGLGYYSRARNLKRAAEHIHLSGHFPRTAEKLIELPGFGPYTSRAVASISFNQKVGVLDGNVIRVISRLYNLKLQWWKTKEREKLQSLADELCQNKTPGDTNQALMELGATICTPTKPKCILCPWLNICKSHKANTETKLPLKKPKRCKEIWVWDVDLKKYKDKVFLEPNHYAPFLKGSYLPPGKAKKVTQKPKKYSFKHNITHHEIFVRVESQKVRQTRVSKKGLWVQKSNIKEKSPTSLMRKTLEYGS